MIGAILALGLVMTAATQLRPSDVPVGPGELTLVFWLGLVVLRQMLSRRVTPNPAFVKATAFWLFMIFILGVGMVVGLAIEPFHDYGGIFRDAAAYGLVLALSLAMTLALADPHERRQTCWYMLVFGSISLLLQIGDGVGVVPVPGFDPWYWDRLRGWAENPNQLGFFSLVLTLLGLHLAETARGPAEAALALCCVVPAFLAGIMSHSDSFTIGLILSGGLVVMLKAFAWVQDAEMAPTLRGAAVVVFVLTMPLAVVAAMPFASTAVDQIVASSEEIYGDNDQGETRLGLWAESVEKGVQSWLIGFGPGPHLTSKAYKRPPPNKFEAHNTFFDLLTQGGLGAVAAFAWISATALVGAARAGRQALAGLVAGLLVFAMFHYVLRHPIFWFAIVLCLLEAAPRRADRPAPAPAAAA